MPIDQLDHFLASYLAVFLIHEMSVNDESDQNEIEFKSVRHYNKMKPVKREEFSVMSTPTNFSSPFNVNPNIFTFLKKTSIFDSIRNIIDEIEEEVKERETKIILPEKPELPEILANNSSEIIDLLNSLNGYKQVDKKQSSFSSNNKNSKIVKNSKYPSSNNNERPYSYKYSSRFQKVSMAKGQTPQMNMSAQIDFQLLEASSQKMNHNQRNDNLLSNPFRPNSYSSGRKKVNFDLTNKKQKNV